MTKGLFIVGYTEEHRKRIAMGVFAIYSIALLSLYALFVGVMRSRVMRLRSRRITSNL